MSKYLEKNSIITKKNNLLSCNVDNDVVLLDTNAGQYLGMNEVASRIWQLIETPQTIETICQQLMQEYEIDRNICEQDVMTFLNELMQKNIIDLEKV